MALWRAPTGPALRRRVFPEPVLPVIVGWGEGRWQLDAGGLVGQPAASLAVGLHCTWGVFASPGQPACALLQLDPLGAYRLFGVPLHLLSGGSLDLAELLGAELHELRDRMASRGNAHDALAAFGDFIVRRLQRAQGPAPEVTWAWRRMLASSGNVSVRALAEYVGWSRKHLRQRFLEQVGASPKAAAQLVRFSAASRLLRCASASSPGASLAARSLAAVAAAVGYADQAHMARAFRTHAGCSPTELARLVDSAGVARVEGRRR